MLKTIFTHYLRLRSQNDEDQIEDKRLYSNQDSTNSFAGLQRVITCTRRKTVTVPELLWFILQDLQKVAQVLFICWMVTKKLFYLPPPEIIIFTSKPLQIILRLSCKISDVYSVNVAAPSSKDNPWTKHGSKSFTS